MKVPVAALRALLPLGSSLGAAIALTALYGLLSLAGYSFFAVWAFLPYLDSALGAGGKFTGFLLRSIFLANGDVNLQAASTVFIQAGLSCSAAAQAGVLGDWFAHASAAARLPLHRRCPRLLPAACKLMALPVVAFGPGLGVPAAVLLFGVRTRDSIATARTLRKWSAWGTLACIAVLTLLSLLAVALAALRWRAARRGVGASPGGKAASSSSGGGPCTVSAAGAAPVLLAGSALASLLLIGVSAAARVRALYQPSVSTTDSLYYCLIVLPELLQQALVSWPSLLHRAGLADSYHGWRTAARPWVLRACPLPAAPSAAALESGRSSDSGSGSGAEPSSEPAPATVTAA